MATDVGTSAAGVRAEIDTELSDIDISDVLSRVERDITRAYSSGTDDFDGTQHRIDFEAALAALRIAEGNAPDAQSRTAAEVSSGRTGVTYDASTVEALRQRVRRRDPGSEFGTPASVRRDTDRYVTSATPGEDV
jgi:hypothetical protein